VRTRPAESLQSRIRRLKVGKDKEGREKIEEEERKKLKKKTFEGMYKNHHLKGKKRPALD